jgi:hypothetical protein
VVKVQLSSENNLRSLPIMTAAFRSAIARRKMIRTIRYWRTERQLEDSDEQLSPTCAASSAADGFSPPAAGGRSLLQMVRRTGRRASLAVKT